jgi:hypothetical protein
VVRFAVEYVIPQNQRRRCAIQKWLAENQCLRDAVGSVLDHILEGQTPLRTGTQQVTEGRLIPPGGDNQIFTNARGHQRRQRIVNHRLVVDRQQLLGERHRDRMQTRAGAACQDNALALFHLPFAYSLRCAIIGYRRIPMASVLKDRDFDASLEPRRIRLVAAPSRRQHRQEARRADPQVQRRTAPLFCSRASSRNLALICANKPGGMNP